MHLISRLFLCCLSLVASSCISSKEKELASDPHGHGVGKESSFVVMGCNRLGKGHFIPGDLSTANIAQLKQSLRDMAALENKPQYLFFCGDIVDNGVDDQGEALRTQLEAWSKLYQELARESGLKINLIPIPGNHEVLRVVNKEGKQVEEPNPATYRVWSEWLKKHRFDKQAGNGPRPRGNNPDLLAADNHDQTYSFQDGKGNHFIVINTDTLNNAEVPPRGWVPANWIIEDLRRAEANPSVRNIFAFGHKPVRLVGFPPNSDGGVTIFNSETHPLAQKVEEAFANSKKFRSYIASHVHIWDCSKISEAPVLWQVIVGNTGSSLIERAGGLWQPPFFFGFTEVQIHANGDVGVVSHNRPVPKPFNSTAPQPAAVPQPQILLKKNNETSAAATRG
jgi:hypothetical protein